MQQSTLYQTFSQNNFTHFKSNESSEIMKGGVITHHENTNQSSNVTLMGAGSLRSSMMQQASNIKAEIVTESGAIASAKQESKLENKQFAEASKIFQTQLNAKPLYKPFNAHEETESREEVVFAKEFNLKPKVAVVPEIEYKSVDARLKAKQEAARFVSSQLEKKSVDRNQIVTYDADKSDETKTYNKRQLTENKVEKERQEILKQEQARLAELEREKKEIQRKREEILKAEERSKVKGTSSFKATKIKQDQSSHGFGSVKTGYVLNKKFSFLNKASSVEPTDNTDSPARKRRNVW